MTRTQYDPPCQTCDEILARQAQEGPRTLASATVGMEWVGHIMRDHHPDEQPTDPE